MTRYPDVTEFSARTLEAIRLVIGSRSAALHEPTFGGNEGQYLQDCLESTFVSTVGPYVEKFEAKLAAFTGSTHVVAVGSGTAALHVALRLAGVGPEDEVLVPALTFVATANAVSYLGAVPHFVDSDEMTLGLDPVALRNHLSTVAEVRRGICVNRSTGREIRAVVPVHTFGHPVAIDDVVALADDYGLAVIEDAAESMGSVSKGRHTGTTGLAGVLSFNGNKIITSGGGGALLTDDPEFAARARHLTTTAKIHHLWEYVHDDIGYNYRLPSLNAALGCAQMEQLPEFLASKRRLFEAYTQAFAPIENVQVVAEPPGCQSNYWLQTLLLDEALADQRDAVLEATNSSGVTTRPAWTPLHRLGPYADCPRASLPVAESLQRRIINLPSSAGLT